MANLTLNTVRFQLPSRQVEAAVLRAAAPGCKNTDKNLQICKSRKKWKTVPRGSVVVRYGRTTWHSKKHRKTYTAWTIAWRDVFGRHREKRNTEAAALARAEQVATDLCNGGTAMLEFGPADQATYLAIKKLCPAGISLEAFMGLAAESVKILGGRPARVLDAARAYALQNPDDLARRTSAQLVDELFLKRKLCSKWSRNLRTILDRFSIKFPEPLADLQARALEDWLDGHIAGHRLGARTRRNYLRAVLELANFAKDRGYLSKAWSVLDSVSDPEPVPTSANLYTPDELVRLLYKAETYTAGAKLVPLIAITAFAGVRHGEMNEEKIEALDWSDIDWDSKRIHVDGGAAKRTHRASGDDRTVDMPDNLVAWLTPYRKPSGKICELSNTSNALCRLRSKAGIQGPKKNALRKSFITYKLALTRDIAGVADQAGNSAAVIRKNYKGAGHTRMRDLAERWFNIVPTRADVLPLFAWKERAATR